MAEKFVFEKAMQKLEEIVNALEKGDVPLDKSLALFEEGTALIGKCNKAIDSAEQKLKMLVKTENGPQEVDFGDDE